MTCSHKWQARPPPYPAVVIIKDKKKVILECNKCKEEIIKDIKFVCADCWEKPKLLKKNLCEDCTKHEQHVKRWNEVEGTGSRSTNQIW